MITQGATYETTRGTFKVLDEVPLTYGLVLQRSDGRQVVVAVSDWGTWKPTLVVKDAF